MRSALTALIAVTLVVLTAGAPVAAAQPAGDAAGTAAASPETATDVGDAASPPPDPDEDVIGWENGIWHNESIDIDQSDGLSDAELDKFVARGMARVEFIREREFKRTVPVGVLSREDYRNRTGGGETNETARQRRGAWNNQVWEGLFIVGENTDAQEALSSTSGSSVAGFYSPTNDQITIITDTPDSPTISPTTLHHELVHALQDQYYNLSDPRYYTGTQDKTLAVDGVIEGEANYVEAQYSERCGAEWSCVPSTGGGGGGGGINYGILYTIFHPYSDGPAYVHDIVEQDGWDAFEEEFDELPDSTEQIIHKSDEEPEPIEFEDEAENGWSTFADQGRNGHDTVGEASIYVMLHQNGADVPPIRGTDEAYSTLNYNSEPSAGWANDTLYPYYRGSIGEDAEYGYVWVTKWDSPEDARQFEEAYLQVLDTYEATREGKDTWVVGNVQYEDAFHVVRDGDSVVIVNAPTVDALSEIRPSITIEDVPSTTTTTEVTTTTTANATTTAEDGDGGGIPGFGMGLATVAFVVLAGLLAIANRRD